MSNNKNIPTKQDVEDYIESIESDAQREDARILVTMMSQITGEPPVMWGAAMVGFDTYHYTYASGREGDWFITGFAPRKGQISVYIMDGFSPYKELLEQLGPHKLGKSCLYIKALSKINLSVLEEILVSSVKNMRERYS